MGKSDLLGSKLRGHTAQTTISEASPMNCFVEKGKRMQHKSYNKKIISHGVRAIFGSPSRGHAPSSVEIVSRNTDSLAILLESCEQLVGRCSLHTYELCSVLLPHAHIASFACN